MLYKHLFGFHVIYPCIIAHELLYQTYSSMGQAGFHRRFFPPYEIHASLGLAPINSRHTQCDVKKPGTRQPHLA